MRGLDWAVFCGALAYVVLFGLWRGRGTNTVNKFLLPTLGGSCEDLETQLVIVSSALLPVSVDSDSDLLVRGLKSLDHSRLNYRSRDLGPEVRNSDPESSLGS